MQVQRPQMSVPLFRGTLFFLLIDLSLKFYVAHFLQVNERISSLLGSDLMFTRVVHRGLVFQWISGWEEPMRSYITDGVAAAIWLSILAIYLLNFKRVPVSIKNYIGIYLIGSLGNLVSTFFQGEATDYLMIKIANQTWLPFNIADTIICYALLMILVKSVQELNPKHSA